MIERVFNFFFGFLASPFLAMYESAEKPDNPSYEPLEYDYEENHVKRRRYKVLPTPKRLSMRTIEYNDTQCMVGVYEHIAPVFNRDGYYLDRQTKNVWFEKGGKAYLLKKEDNFTFWQERMLLEPPLYPEITEALRVLSKVKGLERRERRRNKGVVYMEECKQELRQNNQERRKQTLAVKKAFSDMEKDIKKLTDEKTKVALISSLTCPVEGYDLFDFAEGKVVE